MCELFVKLFDCGLNICRCIKMSIKIHIFYPNRYFLRFRVVQKAFRNNLHDSDPYSDFRLDPGLYKMNTDQKQWCPFEFCKKAEVFPSLDLQPVLPVSCAEMLPIMRRRSRWDGTSMIILSQVYTYCIMYI